MPPYAAPFFHPIPPYRPFEFSSVALFNMKDAKNVKSNFAHPKGHSHHCEQESSWNTELTGGWEVRKIFCTLWGELANQNLGPILNCQQLTPRQQNIHGNNPPKRKNIKALNLCVLCESALSLYSKTEQGKLI